jgi:ParB family chromosome partitioning protein
MSKKPRGLGAGFASLLGDKTALSPELANEDELMQLSLSALIAGRFQPRTQWDEAALADLAASIQSQGVVQPIVVRPLAGGLYEIIAGERRWRASKLAGLTSIPAVIRQLDDQSALAIALIENIQREDLCAIEEARAIRNLTDSFNLTHEQVAQVLGRSREAVSNLLRLLKLELSVQESVLDGQLSAGHARALVALPEAQQKQLAQQAMSLQWSVRALETVVRQLQQPSEDVVQPAISVPTVAPEFEQWREALSTKLGTAVRLTANAKGKGKIEIVFGDETVLKQLIERLQS